MIGIDADYAMSRAYHAQGWPTFVVVDSQGIIRFHGFDSDRELSGVRRALKDLLKAAPADPKQVMSHGIAYPADILKCRQAPRDRSPRLAFDRSGVGNVVYYSNRDGMNAVYLRRLSGEREVISDERLSPPGVESYAPECAVDSTGTLWVAWCSRSNHLYDVYVHSRPEARNGKTEQLSFSDDDAMAPRIATGPGGTVVVTYFKWAKMRGNSRDRNVFAHAFDPVKRVWNREVEISPPEPAVEDHSDPDVVIDSQGRTWMAWSYDYHPQLFKKPEAAEQPTIFAAQFRSNTACPAMLVGSTGRLRGAIDLFPSVAVDTTGVLWCAWDCSEPRRSIQVARRDETANAFQPAYVFSKKLCSTPELSPARHGSLLLSWSEQAQGGRWQGRVARLKDGIPELEVPLSDTGDVLFPQTQQSADGRIWAVYEKADPGASTVEIRELTAQLK